MPISCAMAGVIEMMMAMIAKNSFLIFVSPLSFDFILHEQCHTNSIDCDEVAKWWTVFQKKEQKCFKQKTSLSNLKS